MTGRAITASYDGSVLALVDQAGLSDYGAAIAVSPPSNGCRPVNGVRSRVQCPNPQGALTAIAIPPNPAGAGCSTTTLPAGWNLVGASIAEELTTNVGPLYTLRNGDAAYTTVDLPALIANPELTRNSPGFWALFEQPAEVALACVLPPPLRPSGSPLSSSFTVPAGWSMIGNPYGQSAVVTTPSSDDLLYTYDPQAGYRSTDQLGAGQGAFLYSSAGGTATLTTQ